MCQVSTLLPSLSMINWLTSSAFWYLSSLSSRFAFDSNPLLFWDSVLKDDQYLISRLYTY